VLTITIVGYTVFTLLSGLSWNAVSFAIFQFVARIFLIGEWATSMVYAAEEYPADRRGTMIGVLQAFASLGGIVCAGVAPMLLATEYGWRSVYFVGVIPLAILAFARRGLRETARFEAIAARGESLVRPIFAIWKTPYRRRLIQLATIWFLTYACTQIAVSFWKDFAVTERGLTDADVGRALVVASLVSMPFVFLAGKLLDVVGRKRGSILIFTLTSVGVFFAYTLHGSWPLTIAMALSVFGISAVLPALNAFTTELFPTELRGDAFAWSNNLLGRTGYVLSPIAIGWAAETWSWGAAIRPTALLPLVALALIYLWLPETRHRELEETAAL
jgi:putative MFS transporter